MEKSSEHLTLTHLEQMQHYTDLPLQVAFSAHNEQNSRPIIERLNLVLLWLFRGQHGKKMVCMREVPEVTETLEKANSH